MRADDQKPPKEKEEMDSNELSVIGTPKIDPVPDVQVLNRVKTALEVIAEERRRLADGYFGSWQQKANYLSLAGNSHNMAARELEGQGEFLISAKQFFRAYEIDNDNTIARFFNTPEIAPPENYTIEKNANPKFLFYKGLQALAGIGRTVNQALAYAHIEASAQAGYSRAQWMLLKQYIGIAWRHCKVML